MNDSRTESFLKLIAEIYKKIADFHLGPSHSSWHLDKVLDYALLLQTYYGGDIEVIVASAILHDLGRGDTEYRHGKPSRTKSADLAKSILKDIGFDSQKIQLVLEAIIEHDDTESLPRSVEAQILRDADFLAGFGATGISRVMMWAGETNRNIDIAIERVTHRMQQRYHKLIFPISARIAFDLMRINWMFNSSIKQENSTKPRTHQGRYIIVEGISGAGKNTVAQTIIDYFNDNGKNTAFAEEPGDFYHSYKKQITEEKKHLGDQVTEMLNYSLFLIDRAILIEKKIQPELSRGSYVVSVRSFISTLVYQCINEKQEALALLQHSFVPPPDAVLFLDVDPRKAFLRVSKRPNKGQYETLEDMTKHAERYRDIVSRYVPANIRYTIDANQPLRVVKKEVLSIAQKLLES